MNNKKISAAFTAERTVCRLIAAWCSFAFCLLVTSKGNFFQLDYAQNSSLLRSAVIIFLIFTLYSFVCVISEKEETDSWLLMIGATLCVAYWLYKSENTKNKFLFAAAVIAVYGIFMIYFMQKNRSFLEKINPSRSMVWCFTLICGLFVAAMIGMVTSLRYLTFSASNFDFGIFVNMFHNMKETGLPDVSCERDVLMSHFAVHISPIYYLLLPFYAVFPSPLTLQIGQAVIVASGVIPVVLLCREYKLSSKSSISMVFLYAFHFVLSEGCFYDIHENCFLAPLLLWMFYFFERKQYIFMYAFSCLTLCVKEDAAIYVLIFALYLLLSKRSLRHGAILSAIALVYFSIALSVLQKTSAYYAEFYANQTPNPSIDGPMLNRFQNLIFEKEDGLLGALKTAFFNPGYFLTQLFQTNDNTWEKLTYFFQMLLPLAFLPFLTGKISRFLLISPILLNLLTNYPYQYDIGYQYHFGILAFLLYVCIMNLADLQVSLRRNLIGFAVTACFCFYIVYIPSNFTYYQKAWDSKKEIYLQMDEILDSIPAEASVACPGYILPHIADRREVYELHYHGNAGDVDYIVLDGRSSVDEKQLKTFLSQGYVVWQEDLLIVLKKTE